MVAWSEPQLEDAIPQALEQAPDADPIVFLSDDTVPTQAALDAVLDLQASDPSRVATGFCNLDAASEFVNVTRRPFNRRRSTAEAYSFYLRDELARRRAPVRTWFTGFCLTAMSRDLYSYFPFQSRGRPSDFDLSLRLQDADVPIVASPEAFVWHVKERWNLPDQATEKRVLVGEIAAEIRVDLAVRPRS